MRRVLRLAGFTTAALAVALGLATYCVVRAVRYEPPFYLQALAASHWPVDEASRRLEQQALALHNQTRRPGDWEFLFPEAEINAWLASELPAKFPQLLPAGARDPRVALSERRLQLGVRYEQGGVSTVFSVACDLYLTDEPNEIAVRIHEVHLGALPVPLARFLEEASARAAGAGLALRWGEVEGDPVALVRLPLEVKGNEPCRMILHALEVGREELRVAGTTESLAPPDAPPNAEAPAGPVVQSAESEIRQR